MDGWSPFVLVTLFTVLGTLTGTVVSLFPSLHVYNVAGIALLLWTYIQNHLPEVALAPYFISLVVAFSFINTIPMTFYGAPDESATAVILPGTNYLMQGRGYEAAVLSGVGSLIGVVMLVVLTPFFFQVMPAVHQLLSPNMAWVLLLVMAYMLMSEWPKGCGFGRTPWEKFQNSWQNLFAGIATFALAGFMGIIITTRSIITHEMGFQNIAPVFIGLFAIPSIIQNLLSREEIPEQHICEEVALEPREMGKAAYQGSIAGLIAAYLPAVTAGIGGIIAGHATALRGDVLFIMSGGVAKVLYYVGAFLMLFIITPTSPNGLGKGGLNVMLKPIFSPQPGEFGLMLAVIFFSGCLSFLLLLFCARRALFFLRNFDYHSMYWLALVVMVGGVSAFTGPEGLFVMAVATCIGSIPVFFHSRRSNCMAVLLVPICLNMAGLGDTVANWLGLM